MDTNAAYSELLGDIHSRASCPMRESCYRAGTCKLATCDRVELLQAIDSHSSETEQEAKPTRRRLARPRMVKTRKWKRCSKCRQVKPISEFYKKAESCDGHRSSCKECECKQNHARRYGGWS